MTGLYGEMNANKVSYFNIFDLLKDFKLSSDNLEHLQDVNLKFDDYIKELCSFDNRAILYFLIRSFNAEITTSNLIEDHIINPKDISESEAFFDSLSISHKKIKDLHKEIAKEDIDYEYRQKEAWVQSVRDGVRTIYWYAVNPEDIKKFMDDFILFYRNKSANLIDSSIFIKSALVHLMFMRIHPFEDGNGRTGRVLMAKELLSRGLAPVVIPYSKRDKYINCLDSRDIKSLSKMLKDLNEEEMERMNKFGIKI